MTASESVFCLSDCSWIVDNDSVLQRVDNAEIAVGIARWGTEEAVPITVCRIDGTRPMYEVFGSRTYSVLDGNCRVATVHGPIRVQDLADAFWKGEEVHLEEFSGISNARPWKKPWFRPGPHQAYLPPAIAEQLLSQVLCDQAAELTIPRAVFAELNWLLRRRLNERRSPLGIRADNKTFPTEVTLTAEEERFNKVIAVTKFEEARPWELRGAASAWRVVCDGVIIG